MLTREYMLSFYKLLWKNVPIQLEEGIVLDGDEMTGSVFFDMDDLCVYCSPMWEAFENGCSTTIKEEITIDVMDEKKSRQVSHSDIPCKFVGDLQVDFDNYINTLNTYIRSNKKVSV